MKELLLPLLIATLILPMACAPGIYSIQLRDGKELLSRGEPRYDEVERSYLFEDGNGKLTKINREEIKMIRERGR
jgi:hypothetical protein